MIVIVPVSEKYFVLKPEISAMPITAPGMMYGSIEIVSTVWLSALERRTTRYAISTAITMIIASDRLEITSVFLIERPISLRIAF